MYSKQNKTIRVVLYLHLLCIHSILVVARHPTGMFPEVPGFAFVLPTTSIY